MKKWQSAWLYKNFVLQYWEIQVELAHWVQGNKIYYLSGLLLFEEKLYKKSNNCILDNYNGDYNDRKR